MRNRAAEHGHVRISGGLRRRQGPAHDIFQVVFHLAHIIRCDELQGHRLFLADVARNVPGTRGDGLDDMAEMPGVGRPQADQPGPRAIILDTLQDAITAGEYQATR